MALPEVEIEDILRSRFLLTLSMTWRITYRKRWDRPDYASILERASNAVTQDQHAALLEEARDALELLRLVVFQRVAGVDGAAFQTLDTWCRFMQTVLQWIHFTANAGETELRQAEESLVLEGFAAVKDRVEAFESLKPWSYGGGVMDERTDRLRRELLKKLIDQLWPSVVDACLALFHQRYGIASTRRDKGSDGLAFAVASPRSQLYSADNERRLIAMLETARIDPVVHANAIDYLETLIAALTHHGRYCQRDERLEFLRNKHDLIGALWAAVVARPSQYRFLQSLREHRQALLQSGVPEIRLAVPEWLTSEN